MITNTAAITIDFRSKECKNNRHQNCASIWNGFGIEILCNCECHLNKKRVVLDETPQSAANTLQDACHHTEKFGDNVSR